MAVTIDATATTEDAGVTSVAWSHTVGTLAKGGLYVGIAVRVSGAIVVDSVDLDGVPLTLVEQAAIVQAVPFRIGAAIFRLTAPAAGTGTITVNFSGTVEQVEAWSLSVDGMDQASPLRSSDKTTGTTTPATLVLDSSTGDLAFDVIGLHRPLVTGVTITVGADQAEHLNDQIGVAGAGLRGGGSTEPGSATGAGTSTMSWAFSVNTTYAYAACVIRASTPRLLALLGVGL